MIFKRIDEIRLGIMLEYSIHSNIPAPGWNYYSNRVLRGE